MNMEIKEELDKLITEQKKDLLRRGKVEPRDGMEITPRGDVRTRLEARIDVLEDIAVRLCKEMSGRLGSDDANDSGPTICAILNLGSEAKRIARILESAKEKLNQAD